MAEFRLGEHTYRSRLLNVFDQWHLLNRMRPILPALSSLDLGMRIGANDIRAVTAALSPLTDSSDEDMLYVFRAAQGACERQDGDAWGPVDPAPGMADLMRLVAIVVAENFGPLFAMERPSFTPIPNDSPAYKPVAMPNGEDWLFRPVLRGLCKADGLFDGTLRIEQIAKINDALDVADENEARAHKALKQKR